MCYVTLVWLHVEASNNQTPNLQIFGSFWVFFFFRPYFFKLLVAPLEGTLTTGLLSKDVELKGLPVDVFIFFLTCIVFFWGGGGLSLFGTLYIKKFIKILQNFFWKVAIEVMTFWNSVVERGGPTLGGYNSNPLGQKILGLLNKSNPSVFQTITLSFPNAF